MCGDYGSPATKRKSRVPFNSGTVDVISRPIQPLRTSQNSAHHHLPYSRPKLAFYFSRNIPFTMAEAVNIAVRPPAEAPVDVPPRLLCNHTNAMQLADPVKADYIILFRAPTQNAPQASEQLERLIRYLDRVGLEVETRPGGRGTVLVFVRCPLATAKSEAYNSRFVPIVCDQDTGG